MTRPSILLVTALLAAGTACGETTTAPDPEILAPLQLGDSAQILLNPDMEGGQGSPAGWEGRERVPLFVHRVLVGHGPFRHALACYPGRRRCDRWFRVLVASPRSGRPFTGDARAHRIHKLDNVQGEGVALMIRGDDCGGTALAFASTEGSELIDGSVDWAQYYLQLHDVPAAAETLTVFLIYLPNTTGTAYFDDAVLSSSTTP